MPLEKIPKCDLMVGRVTLDHVKAAINFVPPASNEDEQNLLRAFLGTSFRETNEDSVSVSMPKYKKNNFPELLDAPQSRDALNKCYCNSAVFCVSLQLVMLFLAAVGFFIYLMI